MIIRNCRKLLKELSLIEDQIGQLQNVCDQLELEIDWGKLFEEIYSKNK